MTRPGWTKDQEQGVEAWTHTETGCLVVKADTADCDGWYWEVGYQTYSRESGHDWRTLHDGCAPTLDEAMRSVEWIIAVDEAEQARMERQIDEAAEEAEREWKRQVAEEGQI